GAEDGDLDVVCRADLAGDRATRRDANADTKIGQGMIWLASGGFELGTDAPGPQSRFLCCGRLGPRPTPETHPGGPLAGPANDSLIEDLMRHDAERSAHSFQKAN